MRNWFTPDDSALAYEDERTGDGRAFVAESIRWEGDAWPLQYARQMGYGHDGAVLIGTQRTMTRDGARLAGDGTLDDEIPEGAEAARLLDNGEALGGSVDLDDVTVEFVARGEDAEAESEVVLLASAFPQMSVAFGPGGAVHGIRAPGLRSLAASAGLVAAAGEPAEGDDEVVLWTEASDDILMRVTDARYRGFTLLALGAFDRAAIALEPVEGAAADGTPTDEEPDAEPMAASASVNDEDCGCTDCDEDALVLPMVAASSPLPPADAFDDPQLAALTPLTVDEPDGHGWRRVYGHIAGWSTCHTGSPADACIRAPRSASNYAYFRTGVIATDAGDIPVGQVTIGGGHADLNLSYRGAAEHYDDVSTAVVDVACGEDAHGIWVAGLVRPTATDDDIATLRAASPSGDWRSVGGTLEMMAVHGVNVPGFPVPRAAVAASGRPFALVASGAMAPKNAPPDAGPGPVAAPGSLSAEQVHALGTQIAAGFVAALDEREKRREVAPHRRKLAAIGRERSAEQRADALARLRG